MLFTNIGKKAIFAIGAMLLLAGGVAFTGCTGEDGKDGIAGVDGKDGKNGKDAKVNIDSIVGVIREEVTGTLWDSLYAEAYVDTVYNILFDNTYSEKWMDSIRTVLVDSLKDADYDSLYNELYDNIYADIYTQNVIKNLDAYIYHSWEPINAAFANSYSAVYGNGIVINDYPVYAPISVAVRYTCQKTNTGCRWNKIMVKSWIPGFSDTASTTANLNPDTTIFMGPKITFDTEALYKVKDVTEAQYEVRAYALENDREILFYSATEPVHINPINVNGGEIEQLGDKRHLLYSVWVTPGMDSASHIIKEVSKKLPNGTLKVYQQYSEDKSVEASGQRVVQAVFDVLKTRGIKYIENDGAGALGQKMEYPIEVLRTKRAICNEFSFLVASILEAIGFDTYLVIVPGHMFVGWAVERDGNTLDFIEATQLQYEKAAFADAVNMARETFSTHVEDGDFENGTASLISIKIARSLGIIPNNVP